MRDCLNKIRFYIALLIAKLLFAAFKILNPQGGTSFAGLTVLKLCPDFLSIASRYVKGVKTAITGTNGKTTTAGILSHIFEYTKRKIIHNDRGANMLSGVANTFAQEIGLTGSFDGCVIESDEAYLTKLFDYIDFNYLIVTNLFRDQLDRYGELDTTALKIQNAIAKNGTLKLLLNADDPIVASFGSERETLYYGFEEVRYANTGIRSNAPLEVFGCKCGKSLKYKDTFYAHQGHYYCDCGFERPKCKYSATIEIFDDYSELKIANSRYTLASVGLYNAYNALAAIAMALEEGISSEEIQQALDTYEPVFGRYQKCKIKGYDAVIQLIKNPTGASEVLKTVDLNSHIMIAINDNYADGRDVSWLWDSDFEQLQNVKECIVVSGIRALDMGLRLKYAGIDEDKIVVMEDIKDAVNYLARNLKQNRKITILPSYTALLELMRII